jgi:IS30 family transposase
VASNVPITLEQRELILRLRFEGRTIPEVCSAVGLGHTSVERVTAAAGGLRPRPRVVRASSLTLEEREAISRGLAAGGSNAGIAAGLGRSMSTVWREVKANGGPLGYRAFAADRKAAEQTRRPKASKLAVNGRLRDQVEAGLQRRWSPEQISARLVEMFPDDPSMRVSPETIYQAIYVQGRGALLRELAVCLRTGRVVRRPNRATGGPSNKLPGMVNISQRPAEVADRAVPGHWEGDLIMGTRNLSAIATLVERSTRFLLLVDLRAGRTAELVAEALAAAVLTLPAQLWRSLTWDQGKEMAKHTTFSLATGIDVYFCDPHSPWQRGTNENTNGLLRQYFPKGTSLAGYTQTDLDTVAAELNGRPRKTLGWKTPAERLAELLALTA